MCSAKRHVRFALESEQEKAAAKPAQLRFLILRVPRRSTLERPKTFFGPPPPDIAIAGKKVSDDHHTAHDDYDDQRGNGGAIFFIIFHDKMDLTWLAASYSRTFDIGTLTYIKASTLLSRAADRLSQNNRTRSRAALAVITK